MKKGPKGPTSPMYKILKKEGELFTTEGAERVTARAVSGKRGMKIKTERGFFINQKGETKKITRAIIVD